MRPRGRGPPAQVPAAPPPPPELEPGFAGRGGLAGQGPYEPRVEVAATPRLEASLGGGENVAAAREPGRRGPAPSPGCIRRDWRASTKGEFVGEDLW